MFTNKNYAEPIPRHDRDIELLGALSQTTLKGYSWSGNSHHPVKTDSLTVITLRAASSGYSEDKITAIDDVSNLRWPAMPEIAA